MPIAASTLYDFVQCPTRVALDAFGDASKRDPINPFVRLLWERGTLFERETIAKLDQPFTDLSEFKGEEKEQLTLEATRRGDGLIYGGRISADDLIGIPDLLRKEIGGYIPGDIKSGAGEEGGGDDGDGRPKLHYAVQLALYVDILERLSLSAGRRAFIWDINGEEVPYDFTAQLSPKKPWTLWDEYQTALAQCRTILTKQVTPLPAYSSICKLCHWYTYCLEQLTAANDLTLIPFLGRGVRDAMQDTVPSIAALAASSPDAFITKGNKTIFPGLGQDRLRRFHERAVLLSQPEPKPYLRAPVTRRLAAVELFFDVEVDPLRGICYLHGILERHDHQNETEKFVYFLVEDVSEEAERNAFAAAYAYLSGRADAAIYFYSKYERTVYRKLQAKYPDVCTAADIERLFDPARAIDLYSDVVLQATEWPTRDHSIKTLAKYLGFSWRDAHPSGAASVEWFDRWCRERDLAVRQRILEYNEDDCRATRVLVDAIRSLGTRTNFTPLLQSAERHGPGSA
jgi:predicted RecB family nuclease